MPFDLLTAPWEMYAVIVPPPPLALLGAQKLIETESTGKRFSFLINVSDLFICRSPLGSVKILKY
jgi:hypothetical protein